jgi:hypothetical protein
LKNKAPEEDLRTWKSWAVQRAAQAKGWFLAVYVAHLSGLDSKQQAGSCMRNTRIYLLILVCIAACGRIRPEIQQPFTIAELSSIAESCLPDEWLSGSVLISSLNMIVNSRYDWAAGLSLDGIGPAVAAARQRSHNEALASVLSKLDVRAKNWNMLVAARLSGCPIARASAGLLRRVYAYMFSGDPACLHLVLDWAESESEQLRSLVVPLGCAPLSGQGSWSEKRGERLNAALLDGAGRLPEALRVVNDSKTSSAFPLECRIAQDYSLAGRMIGQAGERSVLRVEYETGVVYIACADALAAGLNGE